MVRAEEKRKRADHLYAYIRAFIGENGYSPSYREMAVAMDVSSTRTVSRYLGQLKEEGKVDWTPKRRRTLRLVE